MAVLVSDTISLARRVAQVYDAAAWSAPGPLSFICVAHDISVAFPDFSRGNLRRCLVFALPL